MKTRRGIPYTIAAVAIGVFCNVLFNVSMNFLPGVPLFMDSLFTVAVTLITGLIPGLVTGLLSNFAFTIVTPPDLYVPGAEIYALCSMSSALVVYLFARKKNALVFFDLFLLSILVAFVNSVLGGIISSVLFRGIDKFPSDYIVAGMLIQDIPMTTAAIFARIPLNLIDKSIAVFGGYGIYVVANRKA
jgi:hypothetical protein